MTEFKFLSCRDKIDVNMEPSILTHGSAREKKDTVQLGRKSEFDGVEVLMDNTLENQTIILKVELNRQAFLRAKLLA